MNIDNRCVDAGFLVTDFDNLFAFHNRLIVALADWLVPQLIPNYEIYIQKRFEADDHRQAYLEVKDVTTNSVITRVEILMPTNKHSDGRSKYLNHRQQILKSQTHLLEIDLLREGQPLPPAGEANSDYRILVSRSDQRPTADLYAFNLADSVPLFPLPLKPDDVEPVINLKALLDGVYERSGYDYFLDYTSPAIPPLTPEQNEWVSQLLHSSD